MRHDPSGYDPVCRQPSTFRTLFNPQPHGPSILPQRYSLTPPLVGKKSDYALALACLRAFWRSFFIIAPPRLCYIAFTFIQPYLLQKILVAFREGTLFDFENGLIVATGIVFFGIGVSVPSALVCFAAHD